MRITASKVGLLSYCQWWARAEAKWDNRSSPAAERGTRFHAAIAKAVRTGVYDVSGLADDIREEYEQACRWLTANLVSPPESGVTLSDEVAFAWDPTTDTAEILDVIDRTYRPTSRLCGTADLVCSEPVGLSVYDWKTGSGSEAGPQLRVLGLMAARAYGVDHVRVGALEVTKHGVTEVAVEELDAFSLAGIAGDIAEQIAAVDTAEPKPGSHCGELYCPARLSCPLGTAATAEIVDVIPETALVRSKPYKLTDPIRTPEHAAWALDVCRLVTAKADAIKESIRAMVPPDGWPLADGSVLRETRASIQAFDKHKALALCKQLGATEEQIAALSYTFEKSNGLRVSGGAAKPRAKRTRAA